MPILLAILAPLLWGSTYAATALFFKGYPPIWMAVWRALPAGLLLLLMQPGSLRRLPLPWPRMLALTLSGVTVFFALLFLATYRLPGAVAGTLGATLPLQMLLLRWVQTGQRPAAVWLGLALLGLLGVVLLLNPSSHLDLLGVLAALSATLLFAQSTLWMERWPVQDVLPLVGWQLLLGGLLLLPVAWLWAGPIPMPGLTQVPGLLWLVIGNTVLANAIWFWGVRRLSGQVMGMLSLSNPMVAVSLGILLVGEHLNGWQVAGISLILLSFILMKLVPAGAGRQAPKPVDALTLKSC